MVYLFKTQHKCCKSSIKFIHHVKFNTLFSWWQYTGKKHKNLQTQIGLFTDTMYSMLDRKQRVKTMQYVGFKCSVIASHRYHSCKHKFEEKILHPIFQQHWYKKIEFNHVKKMRTQLHVSLQEMTDHNYPAEYNHKQFRHRFLDLDKKCVCLKALLFMHMFCVALLASVIPVPN